MPVVQHTNLNQNTVLAVWKITESREELFARLSNRVSDKGINRHDNIHWLASRVLLQELFPDDGIELRKDEMNKPSLFINGKPYAVSITHSYAYAAVMVSTAHAVAVDLEKIDDRVNRVAKKFVRSDEAWAQTDNKEDSTINCTIIWSAKETLYKYYAKKELDFLENLQVLPFDVSSPEFSIEGCITKDVFQLNLPMTVKLFDGYVLTYSSVE